MMAANTLLKDGYLLKRQRGLSPSSDQRRLKFKQRYIRLDTKALNFFEDQKKSVKKGAFPVARMRIVENVPDVTFGKGFCFQIGDEKEIMYFRAKSDKGRKEWMEAFRIAISENEMYDWYHTGVYGQVDGIRWSCCNEDKRESKGCRKTTKFSQRPRIASLSVQRRHDSQTSPEPPTIAEELSTSMPAYSSGIWGDDGGQLQDVMSGAGYLQRPDNSEEWQKKKKDSHRSSIGTSHHLVSEDSGFDRESKYHIESLASLSSSQVNNTITCKGGSYSPMSFRCNQNRKQASSSLMGNAIPESELISPWKLLRSIKVSESQSEITSMVFRGTNTLITASKEGYVHMIDAVDSEVYPDLEHMSATAVGTVDVWKNYLVLGFPNIQIVDLDTKEKKTLQKASEDENCAQFVLLTPEGQLLSYNKAEPCFISIWPHTINSLWPNIPDGEIEADSLIAQSAQVIQSLSVSPDPDQPLIAVVVLLKDTNQRTARIYDYKTKELKQELELHDAKGIPAIAAFHPTGEYVLIGIGKNLLLYDTKNQSYLVQSIDINDTQNYITSLCFHPTGSHLTTGLSTGEVKSFEGLFSKLQQITSLGKPQAPVSASSIMYSKDCQILAVGRGDGTVQLWQVPPLSMLDDILLMREKELIVTSDGAYFTSPDDGYIISVPPGAVAKGEIITLKHGVVPHGGFGQFQFPEGMHPVSSIISLRSTMKHKFLKPIDIAMPHFINCQTPDDCNELIFFKACHIGSENGLPIYRFEEISRERMSLFSVLVRKNRTVMQYAAYSAEHCCLWCIGTYSKKETDKAMFCLIEARPKPTEEFRESRELTIHYCLPYYLPTCLKAVEDQFPDKVYNLKRLTVVFSDDKDPAIHIEFKKDHGGWSFTLQGGNKIHKKDVYFWDYPSCPVLVKMCQTRQYPPRFILKINGQKATESVVTMVSFPGAKEFFKRTVPSSDVALTYHPQGIHRHHISGYSIASSTSEPVTSSCPTNHPFQSAMAEFTDAVPVKLAFYLISQGLIKDEDYEDVKISADRLGSDPEVLNMDLLMKVNRIIKRNPQMIGAVCTALEKLTGKKDIAKKLAKDSAEFYDKIRLRISRSGSDESSSSIGAGSYASAQERLPEPNLHPFTGTVEVESSSHHDFEQASEPFTAESPQLPSHTGSSQGQWIPVSSASYTEGTNLLKPFYYHGPSRDQSQDLIQSLSDDDLPSENNPN